MTDFIIEHEYFEDAHASFVTGAATFLATFATHHLRVAQLTRFDSERAHFAFT